MGAPGASEAQLVRSGWNSQSPLPTWPRPAPTGSSFGIVADASPFTRAFQFFMAVGR
jgi:hypothetical protein